MVSLSLPQNAAALIALGLLLSATALPTPEPDPQLDDAKLTNTSRLVITHVVKTIEFEVGIVDDVPGDDNSTDSDTSEFYETDIQLLNVDLLKEVMNQASGEDELSGTAEPEQSAEQSMTEGRTDAEMPSDSLPLSQPTS